MSPSRREPISPGFDLSSAGSENSRDKNTIKQRTKNIIGCLCGVVVRAGARRPSSAGSRPEGEITFQRLGAFHFSFFFVKS